MESKKQKAIIEAYKALGMNIPENSDENGWVGISVLQLSHVQDSFIETKTDGKTLYGRPVLLENLETNNGWITIESEADLPKEYGWFWINYLGDYFVCFWAAHKFCFVDNDNNYFIKNVTHYQPINDPNPPIY